MFFEVSGGPKWIKNRSKSHLKWRCQSGTQKCPKKCPTWLQNRPKLGPCWAPRSSWTRPRAKKIRHRKRHRKKHPKHKPVWARNGKRASIVDHVGNLRRHENENEHAWLTMKQDKQNQPKNQPKIVPKSTKNRPKMDPKSVQNRSKIGSGTDIASETLFGPILVPF